jgi:cobalamin biosynthesis Mg chelatase CobN
VTVTLDDGQPEAADTVQLFALVGDGITTTAALDGTWSVVFADVQPGTYEAYATDVFSDDTTTFTIVAAATDDADASTGPDSDAASQGTDDSSTDSDADSDSSASAETDSDATTDSDASSEATSDTATAGDSDSATSGAAESSATSDSASAASGSSSSSASADTAASASSSANGAGDGDLAATGADMPIYAFVIAGLLVAAGAYLFTARSNGRHVN